MKRNRFLLSVASICLALGTFATATGAYADSKAHQEGKELKKGEQHAVKVTNVSNERLTNIDIQFSGADPGDFSQTNDCGKKLDRGDSCTIKVTFMPTTPGSKTATMNVLTSEGEQSVVLTGTGIEPNKFDGEVARR